MLDARNQRLRRASDLNMKHSELTKEMQQLQTPFELYVKDALDVSGGGKGYKEGGRRGKGVRAAG